MRSAFPCRGQVRAWNHPALAVLVGALLAAGCSRQQASPQEAPAPPPALEFLGAWGRPGEGPGLLAEPADIAADAVGNVYIADAGSRFVHKFTSAGTPLFSFQDPLLQSPAAIALDRGNAIYVADARRSSILIFFPNGDRLREVRGAGGVRFTPLAHIAVDADGVVHAAEPESARVRSFDARGGLRRAWSPATDAAAQAAPPARLAVAPDGTVLAASPEWRLYWLAPGEASSRAAVWDVTPPGEGISLDGIAATEKAVFLAGEDCSQVQAWSHDGRLLHSAAIPASAAAGQAPGAAWAPCRLAATRGQLVVLDARRHRVLRFRVNW